MTARRNVVTVWGMTNSTETTTTAPNTFPTPLLPGRQTVNSSHVEHTGVAFWVVYEDDGLPLDGPFAYVGNARRTQARHLADGVRAVVTDGRIVIG